MRETTEGLILSVHVIPNASKNVILGWQNGRLKIKVSTPPEKGKANLAVIHLLAKTLHISPSRITLLRGSASRQKEFLLAGFTQSQFEVHFPLHNL